MLRSVDDIIEALGGTSEAASLLGIGRPAVSNWRARGSIPSEHFFALTSALAKRGEKVDRAAFNFRDEARA